MQDNGLNSCYYGSRAIILHTLGVQIMENKMQATKVCWGNSGIMRKRMDTTTILSRIYVALKIPTTVTPQVLIIGIEGNPIGLTLNPEP